MAEPARPPACLFGVRETYDVEIAPDDAAHSAALVVVTRHYPGSPSVLVHEARGPVRLAARAGVRRARGGG